MGAGSRGWKTRRLPRIAGTDAFRRHENNASTAARAFRGKGQSWRFCRVLRTRLIAAASKKRDRGGAERGRTKLPVHSRDEAGGDSGPRIWPMPKTAVIIASTRRRRPRRHPRPARSPSAVTATKVPPSSMPPSSGPAAAAERDARRHAGCLDQAAERESRSEAQPALPAASQKTPRASARDRSQPDAASKSRPPPPARTMATRKVAVTM